MAPIFLWSIGIAALAGTAAWVWLCLRRPAVAVVGVLGLAIFSAHLLALLYQAGVPAEVVRLLIPVKDVAAVVLTGALIWRERHGPNRRWGIAVAGLLCAMTVVGLAQLGGASSVDTAISIRNLAVPVLGVATGLLLLQEERRLCVHWAMIVISTGAAYALVEYLLPLSLVRDVIGVGQYWADVKQQAFHLSQQGTGLPGNFFTSAGVRRLSGSFGDPLSAGYALAAGLILAILSDDVRRRPAHVALCGSALLLTFTRAGLLIVALTLLPVAARSLGRARRRDRILAGLAAAAGCGALAAVPAYRRYVVDVFTGQDDSTLAHLQAIVSSADYKYSLLGGGFGAAGSAIGRGTESVFVSASLQVGVLGLVLYLAALIILALRVRRVWGARHLTPGFIGLSVAVLVTMAISEQFTTFNAGWVLMMVAGLAPYRTAGRDSGDVPTESDQPVIH